MEQTVDIDNFKINYTKVGNGSHNLILLPGAFGTIQTDFKPQLEGLDKRKYTLIAFDPPGYGKSRPPERIFTKDFYHRDALVAGRLMEIVGFKEYSILGWSDGAISGLILADICKSNVKKLISYAGNCYLSHKDLEIMKSIRDTTKWSEKMRKPMENIYGQEYFAKMVSQWVDTLLDIGETNGGDICKSSLSNIIAPTLVLQGDKDPMVPIEHAEYLAKHIPNSVLHVYKGGNHVIHLRYPEEFNKIVDEFLSI